MAKHFGRVVLFAAAAGAAAAGVYYYLTKKDTEFDDDFDDFDDFDDPDFDGGDAPSRGRHYVNLGSGSDESLDEEDEEQPADTSEDPRPDKTEEFFNDEDDDLNDLKKLDGAV